MGKDFHGSSADLGISLLVLVPLMVFGGFVWSKLWAWFVSPLGMPEVGVAQAMGLMMVIAAPVASHIVEDKNPRHTERSLRFAILWLLIWVVGAVIHSFM